MASSVGTGPVGGEYYDEEDDNETLGVVVLWNGKEIAKLYEDRTGLTKIVFTDGSWADLYHRTCGGAAPGVLILADLEGKVLVS